MLKWIAVAGALAVLSLSTSSQIENLVAHGGRGGGDFRYVCEDNGYLVGLRGRVGAWIDNVQAVCAKYDAASGRMYGHNAEGPVFGGQVPYNTTNDDRWNRDKCGGNDVVFSFGAKETKNQPVLGSIALACFDSVMKQRPIGQARRIVIQGSDDFKDGDGSEACPPGKAAVGIRGRSGVYVDAFGLVCAPMGWPGAPKTTTRSNGPGDTTFIDPTITSRTGEKGRLDWCLYPGRSCGEPAAASYCRRNDHQFAVSFKPLPGSGRTIILNGDQDVCAGPHCVAFAEIRCSKTKLPDTSGVRDPGPIATLPGNAGSGGSPGVPPAGGSPTGSKVGNGWDNFSHILAADFTGDGRADLLLRRPNGDMLLFPFVNDSFYAGGGPIKAGNNWNNFTHYWAADWTGDGRADVLARSASGDAYLYAMKNNNTTYGGGPQKVASGWNFTHYFSADFTGDGKPDMIGRTASGDLMLLSTYAQLLPSKVGSGWNFTHYFAADFTGDGKADLVVRTASGDMLLYPFGSNGFYDGGGPIKAGNGWNFTHCWAGDWTGDGVADLLVRTASGEMQLFAMKNNTFYNGGGPRKVGEGWNFTDYFAADFSGDGKPDMVVRTPSGDLLYYPWQGSGFY